MKRVSIFWTGGYDSSFRVCQLSRLNIEIQPYYLSDNRRSEKNELNAIREITEFLNALDETKATILPLEYIPKPNRDKDNNITKSYKTLRKQDFMGSQYEWLAIFAKNHKGVELSIHKDDKAIQLISKHGALKEEIDEDIGRYYVIDEKNSSPDLIRVFKDYHLPLAQYTKKEMKKEYKENGFDEVIGKTWFCFTPINGKPCGKCNPCVYTIEEGMKERFDNAALYRYHAKKTKVKIKRSKFLKKHNSIKKIVIKVIRAVAGLVKKIINVKN